MNLGRMLMVAAVAGLVAAVVEMVFVLPIQALGLGHSPEVAFQSVAMAGRESTSPRRP